MRWGLQLIVAVTALHALAGSALAGGAVADAPLRWRDDGALLLAALTLFVIQTAVLTALLLQRRRRQQAEADLRRSEALLRESEERMRFTVAAVNLGLWQFDRATNHLWATEHCRVMFGLDPRQSMTRASLLAAVHPDDREGVIRWLQRAPITEKSLIEVRIVLPGGQLRWIRVRARTDVQGQSLGRVSGVFIDITDQKVAEAEAVAQRDELTHLARVSILGELSGAIAHEIHQPLTAILSNAQAALLLLDRSPPDLAEVRSALRDIVDEDSRASEVIQRLRGLLRKQERRVETVDFNDLVGATLGLVNAELIARRVQKVVRFGADLPVLAGDPVQIQQIVLNLVMNALDSLAALPIAQRMLTVSTRCTGDAVEVLVRDSGAGIQPGAKTQLFKPFFTSKRHGLGLGLSISATIAQAHGGDLRLENHASGGAVATLSLPVRRLADAAQ